MEIRYKFSPAMLTKITFGSVLVGETFLSWLLCQGLANKETSVCKPSLLSVISLHVSIVMGDGSVHHSAHVEMRATYLSPFTMWAPGIELSSLGWMASTFPSGTISLALTVLF